MLRLYPVILEWLESLAPVLRHLERVDRSLADQLRRSSVAACLNTSEGMGAAGKAKTQCYRVALREMRESLAAIDIAKRLYGAPCGDDAEVDRGLRIVATLVRLAIPRSR